MSRFTIGADGPEARVTGRIALMIAPMLRTWVDVASGYSSRDALAEMSDWAAEVEAVAAAEYRKVRSAGDADRGHGVGDSPLSGDGDRTRREITSDEAGRMLGVTARHVTRLIDHLELTGRKIGRGDWLIDPESVESYMARQREQSA